MTNYVETLVLREPQARDEQDRVLTVRAAPETAGMVHGELERSPGESDERYAGRRAVLDELLALGEEDARRQR